MHSDEPYDLLWAERHAELHVSPTGSDAVGIFTMTAITSGAHGRMMEQVARLGFTHAYDHGCAHGSAFRDGLQGLVEYERYGRGCVRAGE